LSIRNWFIALVNRLFSLREMLHSLPLLLSGLASWVMTWSKHQMACDCFLCGAASGNVLLCAACDEGLPYLTDQRCPQCALPGVDARQCGACLREAPYFDATHALWTYDFPVNRMIQSLKFSCRLANADFFGMALARLASMKSGAVNQLEHDRALPSDSLPDFILPVPLSAERLAARGFNQALEVARQLSQQTGVPLMRYDVVRQRNTMPQSRLPWKARVKNIRHAFDCQMDLTSKTVWVVDDVMTTGATLNELARTLKAHGAARVENWVLARTLKHE